MGLQSRVAALMDDSNANSKACMMFHGVLQSAIPGKRYLVKHTIHLEVCRVNLPCTTLMYQRGQKVMWLPGGGMNTFGAGQQYVPG